MSTRLIPYIMLEGNAHEAISFYVKALNAKILFKQTFGEGPQDPKHPLTAEKLEWIAHSLLKIGDAELFVADQFPGVSLQAGNKLTICLTTVDAAQARQYYESLSEGGEVILPLEEIHFSPAYGMVKDKFGVYFQVFTERQ